MKKVIEWILGCISTSWGKGAQVTNVSLVSLMWKVCRSEKMASGMARVIERSQMAVAWKRMLTRDLWMSMDLTIALYLKERRNACNLVK